METPKVGKLIGKDDVVGRDAIHVAIAPVVAGHMLERGDAIGRLPDGTFGYVEKEKQIGIVDPFLPFDTIIEMGERFYLFLFPGTITSLRHVWTHPDFVVPVPQK